MTDKTKKNAYQKVTDAIIAALDNVDPNDFKKPWFNIGHMPVNAVTKKPYRGSNVLTLGINNYATNYFASYKQWQEKGCQVRKGEKGFTAVFWKISNIVDEDKSPVLDDNGQQKKSFMLRAYTVFNAAQVDGDYARDVEESGLFDLKDHDPIDQAESLINDYLSNQGIKTVADDVASYSPAFDRIKMPALGQFKDPESYYSTYLHEMGHSTGHESRLNRDLLNAKGDTGYAKEELVAEFTAAMLCAMLGISNAPRPDHAQYIKNWLQVLRDDVRFAVHASSQAQKAADFILTAADCQNSVNLMAAE